METNIPLPTRRNFTDLTGQQLPGTVLTVRAYAGMRAFPSGQKQHQWLCDCVCGNTITATTQHLVKGYCKSCGCHAHRPPKPEKAPKPVVEHDTLTYQGETLLLIEWARRMGIPYTTVRWRFREGWDVARILETPPAPEGTHMTAFGESKTIAAWVQDARAQKLGITVQALYGRLRAGKTPEEALTLPMRADKRVDRAPAPVKRRKKRRTKRQKTREKAA